MKTQEKTERIFRANQILNSCLDTIFELIDYKFSRFYDYKPGVCKKDSTNKNCLEDNCKVADGFKADSPVTQGLSVLENAWKKELETSKKLTKIIFKL